MIAFSAKQIMEHWNECKQLEIGAKLEIILGHLRKVHRKSQALKIWILGAWNNYESFVIGAWSLKGFQVAQNRCMELQLIACCSK